MAKKALEDEFEMQLHQEELARLAKEDGEALSRGISYTDEDGTVMEWDHERKAYFPKIDADFIAQYQINYGTNISTAVGQEVSEEDKKAQYEEYWKNYYNVYHQEQPALPTLDAEGNPVETEDQPEQENKDSESASLASASFATTDPTSDEHYEYNLYYYGKEYADAYRDYYKEHPDAEAMPDFRAQYDLGGGVKETAKEEDKKNKKKKEKGEKKGEKRKEPPKEEGWFEVNPEASTQLYVTGLPLDITEDEFKDIMSKCGLIMFDPATGKPKIKLYKDEEGNMKGDGLCTYIKPESVQLAFQIIDGMDLRDHKVTVDRATFSMKGNFDPKKKKKKLSNKAKQKLKEKQQKLFDWRPEKNPFQRAKHERIVILKNMFDLREFDENPALINELRADVREECAKFGEVKKVNLYDRNPEGVLSVTFKEPEEADACIASLNGRWFAQRRILALAHDGKTKYDVAETEEERAKRLQEWESFLEGKRKQADEEEAARQSVADSAAAAASASSVECADDNGAASQGLVLLDSVDS